jgi:hypothetical protein
MIEFQISGRKSGKTTLLLYWLAEAPEGERRVIIEPSEVMAHGAFVRATEMGLDVKREQFISYDSLHQAFFKGSKAVVAIDNLDMLLKMMLGLSSDNPIARVTATGVDVLREKLEL